MNNQQQEEIKETGTIELENGNEQHKIKVFTIIGEIEGHDVASNNTKSTKYDHLLPQLAELEETTEIDGALFLLNTLAGDIIVIPGLGHDLYLEKDGIKYPYNEREVIKTIIAEMIASLSKPTVSLVLGGSHSIGGPLAVATNYSFIVPSGTMVIHPVRSNGMFIGVQQSLMNMIKTQDRITKFISTHSNISQKRVEELMLNPTELVKDVGTMLEGEEAVKEGLIDEVGGIKEALQKLHELIVNFSKNGDDTSFQ